MVDEEWAAIDFHDEVFGRLFSHYCMRQVRARRRGADDGASAPKRQKIMPAMQASKHVSDAPGWCSDPTKKLSAEVIAALDRKCGAHVRARLKESDLRQYHMSPRGRRGDSYFDATLLEGGSGDRTLYQVAEFHEDNQDRHAADLASREAFAASSLDDFRDDCRDVANLNALQLILTSLCAT